MVRDVGDRGALGAGGDGDLALLGRRGFLQVHYQPIVDLQHGRIAGAEALARPDRESGFGSPAEVFRAAAAARRLWEIEAVARRRSLAGLGEWPCSALLFTNCSPCVLGDPRFPDAILREVMEIGRRSPSQIVIELTERTEEHSAEALVAQVETLKAMGFQLAIDDVGAGTSGLNRIMLLRPHWLKLDRELVTGVDRDRVKQHLIRFILHFSRLSGVNILAEGIETEEELQALAHLGVRYGQGYLLGRPAPRLADLSPTGSSRIRRLWGEADTRRFRPAGEVMASRFARDVLTLPAESEAGEAADLLGRKADAPGVALLSEGRLAGWCDRSDVLDAARADLRAKLFALSRSVATLERDETTVGEMLELATCREPADAHRPLIVVDNGEVVGLLGVAEIIRAAAETSGSTHLHSSSVVGCPGRVRCDLHVRDLLLRQTLETPDPRGLLGYDAAFVDIRDFSEYNWTYGHELGDRLLQHLATLLKAVVARQDLDCFVGHLGDDRFLLTALRGRLTVRLRSLIAHFDRSAEQFARPPLERELPHPFRTVGIRALLIENAFRRVSDVQDLLATERRLRVTALGREAMLQDEDPASVLIVDREEDAHRSRAA